jgi:hypothetical protein
MSRDFTARDFLPHVGKTGAPKGHHLVLTLVSVTTTRLPGWERMPREPFTLILRGPPGDPLVEGLYDVTFEEGPDFALYIIPIHTAARDRQDYQVVFN